MLKLLPYRISLIINSFENYLTPAIKIKNYNINIYQKKKKKILTLTGTQRESNPATAFVYSPSFWPKNEKFS